MGRLEAHIDAQNFNLILTHKIVYTFFLDGLVSSSLRDFWTSLKLNHPTQSQLAKRIKATHLILGLENIIKQVHKNCLLCTSLATIPTSMEQFSTTSVPACPYQQCSADVLKRAKQSILVVTDTLTQQTSTAIIKSEKSDNILKGLIRTVLPFKISSLQTKIKVDTAPDLSSLIKNANKLLI